jgi:SAM-dependent methyltransferase
MSTRETLMRGYHGLARAVAPGLRHSQSLYEDELRRRAPCTSMWLDLGCGRSLLPPWRSDAERDLVAACGQLVGVDVDYDAIVDNHSLSLKCLASATTLPFADGSFNLVTANMVVEHLDDPATQFREIARILKPDGVFILHTPNALGYPTRLARLLPGPVRTRLAYYLDGRAEEDVYPTFYRANSGKALESLARESALTIRELRYIVTTPVFALVLPIALFELLWLRVLMTPRFARFRTNIIAVLQKGASPSDTPPH